jgi:hypothetical protein
LISSIHGKFQNAVTILVGETDREILKDLGADRRTELRWILKYVGLLLYLPRRGSLTASCEQGNEFQIP